MRRTFIVQAVLLCCVVLPAHSTVRHYIRTSILESPESTLPLKDVAPPRVTFMVQRLVSSHKIAELLLNQSHILLVDSKENLVRPPANWTNFGHYVIMQPPTVCTTDNLPRGNCTGFTMSTWSIWHDVFGFTEFDDPEDRKFRLHIPVLLQSEAAAMSQQDTSATTELIVANQDATVTFVCADCPGSRSEMTATEMAILLGTLGSLFVVVGVCCAMAYVYDSNVPAEPRRVVTRETIYM